MHPGGQGARASYITWPLLDADFRTIEKFKAVAERLNLAGAQVKKAGLTLAYHNHDFEFVDRTADRLRHHHQGHRSGAGEAADGSLWIARGSKLSPNEWFKRAPGRFEMWHVKDMHKTSRDYTELGNGSIDFTKIWPDAKLAGLKHFFVEQGGNFTHDPFRSVSDSADYVKKYLLQ